MNTKADSLFKLLVSLEPFYFILCYKFNNNISLFKLHNLTIPEKRYRFLKISTKSKYINSFFLHHSKVITQLIPVFFTQFVHSQNNFIQNLQQNYFQMESRCFAINQLHSNQKDSFLSQTSINADLKNIFQNLTRQFSTQRIKTKIINELILLYNKTKQKRKSQIVSQTNSEFAKSFWIHNCLKRGFKAWKFGVSLRARLGTLQKISEKLLLRDTLRTLKGLLTSSKLGFDLKLEKQALIERIVSKQRAKQELNRKIAEIRSKLKLEQQIFDTIFQPQK